MAEKGYNMILSLGGTTVATARDVNYTVEATKQDITTRADTGWRNSQGGLKELTGTAKLLVEVGDTAQMAIKSALLNDTTLAFIVSEDGGSAGYSGTCRIQSTAQAEPIDDAVFVDVAFYSVGVITALDGGS